MAKTTFLNMDGMKVTVKDVQGSVYESPGTYKVIEIEDATGKQYRMSLSEPEADILRGLLV